MDGYGEGNDNKLPHMAKIIGEAGFAGIEPMVLEPYDTYWLGDCKDPQRLNDALDEAGIELAALALIMLLLVFQFLHQQFFSILTYCRQVKVSLLPNLS